MNIRKSGGPAFPLELAFDPRPGTMQCAGMTILDYFAAQALLGLLARHSSDTPDENVAAFSPERHVNERPGQEKMARQAYQIAACMIDAREEILLAQIADEE